MERALEQALDRADCIIASAQQSPPKRNYSSSGGKSLHEKLYDIYVEECEKDPEARDELISNVNLLEKLVKRESLPCLVVNLYPGKEGYSLMLKGQNESYSEIMRLPYEEGELLKYLDAEQLSPALVDLLEQSEVNIFHSGCVIADIRDYRQCSNMEAPGYQSRHVLLRPTMQTLACDVQSITNDNQKWTEEDKLLLESQLTLATAEPLCLDPSVSVACTENRLLYNKQKMNMPSMKRNLKMDSAASLYEQQELLWSSLHPELGASEDYDLKISQAGNCAEMWNQQPCDLTLPSEMDVEKNAEEEKPFQNDDTFQFDDTFQHNDALEGLDIFQGFDSFQLDDPLQYNDLWPTVSPAQEVEDVSVFGCEAGDPCQTTELTSMQPPTDPPISEPRKSKKKGRCNRKKPHCYSFIDEHSYCLKPKSKTAAGKGVSQPKELVQKSARRPVKVSQGASGSASLSQLSPGKEAEQPQARSVQSAVLGQGVQHSQALVSLPSSSGSGPSGNSFTPQQASSSPKCPSPAPALKPASLPQKSFVEVSKVTVLPRSTRSTTRANSAGSRVVHLLGPFRVFYTVAENNSNEMQGSTPEASTPARAKSSSLPSAGQPPNASPAAAQAPSQGSLQFILRVPPNLRPTGLLWVPPGSRFLNPLIQQQDEQPQQLLHQLIPEPELQQPHTSYPQQPVSWGSRAQGTSSQQTALSAQQTAVTNLKGVGSVMQHKRRVGSQPGCARTRPIQRAAGPSAFQQQQQQQPPPPQQQQPPPLPRGVWRIFYLPALAEAAAAAAAAQTAQPDGGQQTASQDKGQVSREPPHTPKS